MILGGGGWTLLQGVDHVQVLATISIGGAAPLAIGRLFQGATALATLHLRQTTPPENPAPTPPNALWGR